MIPDKLKDDFNSLRNMFDELKREIDTIAGYSLVA